MELTKENATIAETLKKVTPVTWDLKYLYLQVFQNNGEYITHIWIRKIGKPLFALGLSLIKTFGVNNVSFAPVADPPSPNYSPEAFVIYTPDNKPIEAVIMTLRKLESLYDIPADELRRTVANDLLKWNAMKQEVK
jgi:hypothetical protein